MADFNAIMKEGWCEKRSRYFKSWRRRWAVLTPQYLYTFKNQQAYNTSPTETINMQDCVNIKSAEEDVNLENAFRVDTRSESFFFRAQDAPEKEQWIGAIGRAMMRPRVMMSRNEEEELNQYV